MNSKFIISISVLSLVIILNIVAAKIAFDNFTRLNSDLSQSQKLNTNLKQKLTSLQSIAPQISNQAGDAIAALPDVNSVVSFINQLKSQVGFSGVNLQSLSATANPSTKDELSTSDFVFEIIGNYTQIQNFIINLEKSSPVVTFNTFTIQPTAGGDTLKLTGDVNTYSSTFPTTIPAIDDPVTDLNDIEKETLKKVMGLTKANFANSSTASQSGSIGKTNPFQ